MNWLPGPVDVKIDHTVDDPEKYRDFLARLMTTLDEADVESIEMKVDLDDGGAFRQTRTVGFELNSKRLLVSQLTAAIRKAESEAGIAKGELTYSTKYSAASRAILTAKVDFRPNIMDQTERRVRRVLIKKEKPDDVFDGNDYEARDALQRSLIPVDIFEEVLEHAQP